MNSPPPSAEYGERIIASLIDARARSNHARPIYSIPTSPTTYQDITYAQFANAVNRCSRWLLQHVGFSHTSATITYLGPSDLRYQLFILAAHKTGHVLFVPSPRNSEEAFRSLLNECETSVFLTTSDAPRPASTIMEVKPDLRKYIVPDLQALLDPAPVDAVDFKKPWVECRHDPFVRVHTSGTTGIPKLVTLPHGSFSAVDATQKLGTNELAHRFGGMRVFCAFPPFHLGGIGYSLAILLWVDSTVVLPPLGPLDASIVNDIHKRAKVEFSLLLPSILTEIANDERYLDNLASLSGVNFSGGPLSESVGGRIASRTRLMAGYGATEFVALPQVARDREDWPYLAFDVDGGGLEFHERDEGLFELVVKRRPALDRLQAVFVTFPQLQEYRTKDLFEKHPDPSKGHLWKYKSRLDDIIVFNNGEKLNPVTMEGIITTCPAIKGCLIVGQGYFQAALLIEPAASTSSETDLIETVWPYVQQANVSTVKHGRVAKDLIRVTTPNKPFARAGKGTIQRAASNKLYEPEISELYGRLEQIGEPAVSAASLVAETPEATKAALTKYIQSELHHSGFDDTTDFFAMGFDSLQLLTLVRAINTAHPDRKIDLRRVYNNPTVEKLAWTLHSGGASSGPRDAGVTELHADWLLMERMYQEITGRWTSGQNVTVNV